MNTTLLILIALSALASITAANIVDPTALFDNARDYQSRVSDLQHEISAHVTGLRSAVSDVLRKTSNETLTQIDTNIHQTLALDRSVREVLQAATDLQGTACLESLITRLDAITVFSGFDASICLARHDRNLALALTDINGQLQQFEGGAGSVQLIVVRSFVSMNVWTQPDGISERFVVDYERVRDAWNANSSDRQNLVLKLSESVQALDGVLIDCLEGVRLALVPRYGRFARDLESCREFHDARFP
jgi:hypothetical protein